MQLEATAQANVPVITSEAKKKRRSRAQTSQPILRTTRLQQAHAHVKRCTYMSSTQLYCTREWEDDDNHPNDYEFTKEEANELHADAPNLEIPKWTEHEVTPLYCIEGTEDLSDDIFHKRHAILELDERWRKKCDEQQVREQCRSSSIFNYRNFKFSYFEFKKFLEFPKVSMFMIEALEILKI